MGEKTPKLGSLLGLKSHYKEAQFFQTDNENSDYDIKK